MHEGPGDFQPPLHSTGKRFYECSRRSQSSTRLKAARFAPFLQGRRNPIENAVELHIFKRRHFAIEARVLENYPERFSDFILLPDRIIAVDPNLALMWVSALS